MAKKAFTPIPPMAELPPAEEINVREILDKYLTGEIDLICVLGPTASGKTRYAVKLAREINALLTGPSAEASAKEKRATPLAAGGGARSEGVGGVVLGTAATAPCIVEKTVYGKHGDDRCAVIIAAKAGHYLLRSDLLTRYAADDLSGRFIVWRIWIEPVSLARTYSVHMGAKHQHRFRRVGDVLGYDVVADALVSDAPFLHPSADTVAYGRLAE